MSEWLPFLIVGLVSGSIYGLAGSGLVLTYKTSGILNFAHGALAAVAVYLFYALWIQNGLPWWAGALVGVFGLGPTMGILMELLARRLANVDSVMQVTATVGIILLVQGAAYEWWGTDYQPIPNFLPTETFEVAGANVAYSQVITFGIAIACVVGLAVLLHRTRLGLLTRAVVDSSELLDSVGMNPVRIRRWSWIIGATFASLAGILLSSVVSLDATVLTFLVIVSFGAAAVGRFTNLPMTCVGGLVVGILESVSTKAFASVSSLAGLTPSIPFLVLFVLLIVLPRSRRAALRQVRQRVSVPWRAPLKLRISTATAIVVLMAFIPAIFPVRIVAWTTALAFVVVFLALGLLIKTSGQVSLCHLGFMGIGAAAFAHFTTGVGMPWLVALVCSGLVAIPFGAVVAIPAARVSGVFLALSTLGYGVILQQLFFSQSWLFGAVNQGMVVPRPSLSFVTVDSDTGYFYTVLVVVVVVTFLLIAISETRLGRLLRGLSDSPLALATHGVNVNTLRVLVFCISAFFAGIGGSLFAANVTNLTDVSFAPALSLTLVAILVIQPGGIPWYAVVAAIGYQIIPTYINGSSNILTMIFGASAILYAIHGRPAELPRAVRTWIESRLGSRRSDSASTVLPPQSLATDTVARTNGAAASIEGLRITNLKVTYGGTVAVNDLSLNAPMHRVTALIGPNGAGKTTVFNACSGLLQPAVGEIELHGERVSGKSAAARARRGLGRTFQTIELFDSLTVRENLWLGREPALAGRNPLRQVFSRRAETKRVAALAIDAATRCGIADLLDVQAGLLSTGQRRLVELARCIVGEFDVLLLDEPSSGLDRIESEQFGRIVRSLVDERGLAVLMVEHDMSLVMDISDHIYVLDFGTLLFDGTPEQVANNELVQAAYLGGAELEADLQDLDVQEAKATHA